MERDAYRKLLAWKQRTDRKPLVLNGARQVGKTWLLNEFGRNEYKNVAVINFDQHPELQNAFQDYDPERLLRVFSAVSDEPILPRETLVILDEIQEAPGAIVCFKVDHCFRLLPSSDSSHAFCCTGSDCPVADGLLSCLPPVCCSQALTALTYIHTQQM